MKMLVLLKVGIWCTFPLSLSYANIKQWFLISKLFFAKKLKYFQKPPKNAKNKENTLKIIR